MSMYVGGKFRNGWADREPDGHRVMTLELDLLYIKQSHIKVSAQYVKERRRKVQKNMCFQYSKFRKGHNSHKN